MQKLHLVGFTTDHKSLILSARRGARSGGFVLEVDDDIAAAISAALEHAGEGAAIDAPVVEEDLGPPRPQSTLSVKELQARLRIGRTIESVAAEAGVDVEWVTRFAVPVFAEQIRVIEATRNATFSRARLGPSALRLGASVYRNLAAKGLTTPPDELDKGWATRQIAEGRWLVTFTYVSRNRKQKASWELDLRAGEVRATDRLGADLAFVPGAPKPASPTAAPTKPVKVPASAPTDLDRANARRVAVARKTAEAQLADAARRGTKQSVEVVKRATSPKAAAERAKRLRAELAALEAAAAAGAAEPEDAIDTVDAIDPVGPVEVVEAQVPVVTVADLAPTPVPVAVAVDPEPFAPAARAAGAHLDPAANAVAVVRETAEALLSDFASGRLSADDLAAAADGRPAPTWEAAAAPAESEPAPEPVATPVAPVAPAAPGDEVVRATTPVPSRRRRPPIAPAPRAPEVAATPVVEPPSRPARSRPDRALGRAATPPVVEPVDDSGRRRRHSDDRLVRTPLDLAELPAPASKPERRGPTFRDDLASPANANGADGADGAELPARAPGPAPARRRRSEPLRAR